MRRVRSIKIESISVFTILTLIHSKSTLPLSKVLLILLRARTTKQASTYLVYTEAISQVCNIIILRRANNLVEPVVEKPMWFYPLNPCQMPNFKIEYLYL